MQDGTQTVESGKRLAAQTSEALTRIIDRTGRVSDVISQLANDSEQQASSSKLIERDVEVIHDVTRESASGIQQIAHTVESLSHLTMQLQRSMERFKLEPLTHEPQRIHTAAKRPQLLA
jgi:methyl-accepting chemotaxis protein